MQLSAKLTQSLSRCLPAAAVPYPTAKNGGGGGGGKERMLETDILFIALFFLERWGGGGGGTPLGLPLFCASQTYRPLLGFCFLRT